MNKITQEKIAIELLNAIEAEDMMLKDVAEHLGLKTSSYLSMIKRDVWYNKVPVSAWMAMRNWLYSGKSLRDYRVGEGAYEEEEKKADADLIARMQDQAAYAEAFDKQQNEADNAMQDKINEELFAESIRQVQDQREAAVEKDIAIYYKALKKEIESQPIVKVSSKKTGPAQEIIKRFTVEIEVKCNIK